MADFAPGSGDVAGHVLIPYRLWGLTELPRCARFTGILRRTGRLSSQPTPRCSQSRGHRDTPTSPGRGAQLSTAQDEVPIAKGGGGVESEVTPGFQGADMPPFGVLESLEFFAVPARPPCYQEVTLHLAAGSGPHVALVPRPPPPPPSLPAPRSGLGRPFLPSPCLTHLPPLRSAQPGVACAGVALLLWLPRASPPASPPPVSHDEATPGFVPEAATVSRASSPPGVCTQGCLGSDAGDVSSGRGV